MTADTLTDILRNIDTGPSYVPPVSAYTLGRKAYRAGLPYTDCVTDDMRSGWLAAEGDAGWLQRGGNYDHSAHRSGDLRNGFSGRRRGRVRGVPGGSTA